MMRVKKSAIFLSILLTATAFQTASALNLNLWGENTYNKIVPNCYIRKEYNYFLDQWTNNEVCHPSIYELPESNLPGNRQEKTNKQDTNTYYIGKLNQNSNTSGNYSGYYTGNNNYYTPNTWNGTGNLYNYLMSSFGGSSIGYYNDSRTLNAYVPYLVGDYISPTYYEAYDYYDYSPAYYDNYLDNNYYENNWNYSNNDYYNNDNYVIYDGLNNWNY